MYRAFCATLQQPLYMLRNGCTASSGQHRSGRRVCYTYVLSGTQRISLPTVALVLSDYKDVVLRMDVNVGLSLCPRVLRTALQPWKISDPSPGGGEDMVHWAILNDVR
jgi:hypothetical protein